jgi:hypothetical protein
VGLKYIGEEEGARLRMESDWSKEFIIHENGVPKPSRTTPLIADLEGARSFDVLRRS